MSGTRKAKVLGEDGTEISFEWVYEGAEACTWMRDTEHWTSPMPPMELWLHEHWAPGADRAWAEANMEPPAMFYRFQYAGPFLYARETMYEPERMMRAALRYREVAREYGGALTFWRSYCRPRIEQVCRDLAALDGNTSLLQTAELWGYGFHQTFTSLVPLFEPAMQLGAMLGGAVGEISLDVAELTLAGENPTQAIDSEIWELSELARAEPAVTQLLAADRDVVTTLRREPAATAFVEAFDALIARHGTRAQGWELTSPTWGERPEALLALVRARTESHGASPTEIAAGSAARQQAAKERALARLSEEKHAEFTRVLSHLDGYVNIREDRAYWQMVLSGEVRGLLLRTGERLVASGRIDRPDDVFFLEPDDIETGVAPDLRSLVIERRRAWEAWRGVVAPATIGTLAAAGTATVEAAPNELRGSAASRGVVTGTARIIHSPEEGTRLRPGDIMVCVMSTPAWTPLFAIAGGIVSETGGALSHPAITAREYGIPAVVAVKDALARIRDGQKVTVDGAAGVVRLEA